VTKTTFLAFLIMTIFGWSSSIAIKSSIAEESPPIHSDQEDNQLNQTYAKYCKNKGANSSFCLATQGLAEFRNGEPQAYKFCVESLGNNQQAMECMDNAQIAKVYIIDKIKNHGTDEDINILTSCKNEVPPGDWSKTKECYQRNLVTTLINKSSDEICQNNTTDNSDSCVDNQTQAKDQVFAQQVDKGILKNCFTQIIDTNRMDWVSMENCVESKMDKKHAFCNQNSPLDMEVFSHCKDKTLSAHRGQPNELWEEMESCYPQEITRKLDKKKMADNNSRVNAIENLFGGPPQTKIKPVSIEIPVGKTNFGFDPCTDNHKYIASKSISKNVVEAKTHKISGNAPGAADGAVETKIASLDFQATTSSGSATGNADDAVETEKSNLAKSEPESDSFFGSINSFFKNTREVLYDFKGTMGEAKETIKETKEVVSEAKETKSEFEDSEDEVEDIFE